MYCFIYTSIFYREMNDEATEAISNILYAKKARES
jgi:hypothetical protein